MAKASLLELAGGISPIREVLTRLYDRLFDDAMVGFLFVGHDKQRIVDRQVEFTANFLGGTEPYRGRPLPETHATLPLLPGHFDRRHHLLREVLGASSLPEAVRDEWLRVDASLRTAVLRSGEGARERARKATE